MRTVFWPGPLLGTAAVALSLAALPLLVLNGDSFDGSDTTGSVILAVSFAIVGAMIVSRRPSNVIGWVLLGAGCLGSLNAVSDEYATYVLVTRPGLLPGGGLMAWLAAFVWALSAPVFPLVLLLFPTGRPPAQPWRWLLLPIAMSVALVVVPMAISVWQTAGQAIEAGDLPDQAASELAAGLTDVGTFLLGLSLVGALVSWVARFIRSRGDERQQLKWLGYAGCLTLLVLVTASPATPLEFGGIAGELLATLPLVALPAIPVAIAIAMFRYRLYDIDRIISRTVGYGLVLAVLGLVYTIGAVWLPTRLLGEQPPVFVAGATLAAAALFNPVRRRTLRAVDRRFYRSRYDSERITEGFTSSLRHQVDPSMLADDLAGVVTRTLHPSAVGVWVRETS